MARERSEKSKNKPVDGKARIRTGKSDERASTRADPSGEVISGNPTRHDSLQPAARSKKRQEQQRIEIEQEPSADVRESQKVLEQGSLNGGQSIEDDWSTHHRIAERAFILFQESGYEHGNDWSHWFEAERADKRNS